MNAVGKEWFTPGVTEDANQKEEPISTQSVNPAANNCLTLPTN